MKKLLLPLTFTITSFAQTSGDISFTATHNRFDDRYYLYHHKFYYGLRSGLYFDDKFGIQLGYDQTNNANCKGLKLKRTYLNGLFMLDNVDGFKPYIVGTIAHEKSSIEDHKPSQTLLGLGGGVRYDIANGFGAYLESKFLRGQKTHDTELATTLGLYYNFNTYIPENLNSNDIKTKQTIKRAKNESNELASNRKIRLRPVVKERPLVINHPPIDKKIVQKSNTNDNGYYIQLALLSSSSPLPLIKKAKMAGYNVKTKDKNGATAVVIGPYISKKLAQKSLKEVKRFQKDAFVTKF